jgi:DNA-binding NtrC family response regulator
MPTSVLAVDDDPIIRKVVAAHLKALGYDPVLAPGVDEALAILAVQHIHIVLTDLEMPGKDGFAFLRILRDEHPLIRSIVLTSHDDVGTVLEVLRLGAFSFLAKPVRDRAQIGAAISQAEEVVRCWLDRLAELNRRRRPSSAMIRPEVHA